VYPVDSIAYDFDQNARNYNGAYDVGCYEYINSSMSLFVNSGGAANGSWEADLPHATLDNTYNTYVTGSTSAFGGTNNTTAPSQVLGTYRYTLDAGTTIRYNIPVPASGDYEVELYFARKTADTFVSGQRRFNIFLEGQNLVTYDVYDQGGVNGTAASSYTHTVTVNDGMLEVKLVAVNGAHSMINAIRVEGPVETQGQSQEMAEVVEPELTQERPGVYPNPARDYITVTSPGEDIHGIRIISAQREVYSSGPLELKAGESKQIDISQLPENQLYIIHLQSRKGIMRFKFVKGTKN
jgi:hypothetical protein